MQAAPMKIQDRVEDDVAVVTVSGDLTTRPNVAPFHKHIQRLVKNGIGQVVVDCSKAKWFGAAMLGELVAGLTILRRTSGEMYLAGLPKKVKAVLSVTRLEETFVKTDTVDRALDSIYQKKLRRVA